MQSDLYLKAVLGLIASALLVIAYNGLTYRPVEVYAMDCGRNAGSPCYVSVVQHRSDDPLKVELRDSTVRIDDRLPVSVRVDR